MLNNPGDLLHGFVLIIVQTFRRLFKNARVRTEAASTVHSFIAISARTRERYDS